MGPAIWLWCARVTWAVVPVLAGGAIGDGVSGWPAGPARLAAVVCWAAWAVALFALFAPRPWGCTLLRIVMPSAVVVAVACVTSTSVPSAIVAVASTVLAAFFALSEPVVAAAGNALAYGDEVRFPMRIPTPLLLAPVPLATAVVVIGALAGPLFLADARFLPGIICTLIGVPLAVVVARSLDSLSRRWVVSVPAGFAIVDSLTLLDPVLVRREAITSLHRVPGTSTGEGALDLRLGTIPGGIEFELGTQVLFGRRRGRIEGELLEPPSVVVAVARPGALLALARDRRIATR